MTTSTVASTPPPITVHGSVTPGPAIAVLGTFDGVHLGHRRLVSLAVDEARAARLSPIAVTFDPHPLRVVAPDKAPLLLTTTAARVRLLREAGAEAVAVVRFNQDTAALSPREFVEHVLIEQLSVHTAVVGRNFRFGRRGAGTPELLAEILEGNGGTARNSELVELEGTTVSSTEIRDRLERGDVEWASHALGRPHQIPLIELPETCDDAYTSKPNMLVPAERQYGGAAYLGRWTPAKIDVMNSRRITVHIDPAQKTGRAKFVRFHRSLG